MRIKLIVVLVSSFALAAPPSIASVQDMSPDANLTWGVEESYGDSGSQAVIIQKDSSGSRPEAAYCNEFGRDKFAWYPNGASCDPSSYKNDIQIQFSVLQAPVCDEGGRNCLNNVFATGPDGKRIEGKFLGYVNPDSFVPANKTLGNPAGASSGVWQIEGVINSAGTDLYEVHVNMEGGLVDYRKGRQVNKFSLKNRSFNAAIRPVKATVTAGGVDKDYACSNCESMPTDFSFGFTAILPESIINWYSGRIQNADVLYQKVDSDYYAITVTGKPIEVPTFRGNIKRKAASEDLLEQFHWCQSEWPQCWGIYTNGYGNEGNWTDFLDAWRPLVGDSATGSATIWTIRSVPVDWGNGSSANFYACTPKNRPAGIVSTNALMFNGNVPNYEKGFFNYRVAGMHFEADGQTEFLGRYEMVMDEKLARCMFNFPKAPLSATVTVSGEKGETVVATTTVASKGGKLRLAAYNFTFSEKNIKFKLTAKGYATCTKGKVVRYVKGSKCPSGFKNG